MTTCSVPAVPTLTDCSLAPPSMGELMRMTRPMGEEARIPRGGPFSSRCCFFSRYRVAEPTESPGRWQWEERELRELELRSPGPGGSPTTNFCAMLSRSTPRWEGAPSLEGTGHGEL